jgi:hypothetical protein
MRLATARLVVLAIASASTVAAAQTEPGARRPDMAPPIPQPLLAIAHRDLTFGTVLPGIPSSVPSLHPRHSGMFEVHGTPGSSVRVEFVLPAALASPASDLMPIAFGGADGFADFSRGRPPRGVVFDPHLPLLGDLGPNGRLFLRLGGTVLPSLTQTGGEYVAIITLTVFDLGI